MALTTIVANGALSQDVVDQINANFTAGTGGALVSPTISGTVSGGATYTSPIFTTPALGAATGASIVLTGDMRAATFHAGATAGVTAGPFTTVASINVIAGIVTTLTGS